MTRARALVRTLSVVAINAVAIVALAGTAVAQEFVKVEDGARDQLPATPFVGAAYGFIWVAILVYVLMMARRMGRVQNELQELRRRIERSGAGTPPRP